MLKAIVVIPNEKTNSITSILRIAIAEARRREHTKQGVVVKAVRFIPECQVYAVVYESSGVRGGR